MNLFACYFFFLNPFFMVCGNSSHCCFSVLFWAWNREFLQILGMWEYLLWFEQACFHERGAFLMCLTWKRGYHFFIKKYYKNIESLIKKIPKFTLLQLLCLSEKKTKTKNSTDKIQNHIILSRFAFLLSSYHIIYDKEWVFTRMFR